jgi:putative phosphoribosyl transferase
MTINAGGRVIIFRDREDAGRALAQRLRTYANRKDVIVLGVPRGGVPVAFEVARELKAPLEVFVLRKLGVPGQEELAFGAIASGGGRFLDDDIVRETGISDLEKELISAREWKELERRERVYRNNRPALNVRGLTVILVDDGIATGACMRAGARSLRQMSPARIVVAVPVAHLPTCKSIEPEVDELVCVCAPESFFAIGQFYEDFSQLSDEEVTNYLQRSNAWPSAATVSAPSGA